MNSFVLHFDRDTLSNTLISLNKLIPGKPTHPVLANVLFKPLIGTRIQCSLTAFDLSNGMTKVLDCAMPEQEETFAFTLPGSLLMSIIKSLPSGSELELLIERKIEDETECIMATITCQESRFSINGMSANEYPEMPQFEEQSGYFLPSSVFKDCLKQALFCASKDETKQILKGVHISPEVDSEKLTFMSTDGHRASIVTGEITPVSEIFNPVTLPSQSLNILVDNLTGEGDLQIILDESRGTFVFDNTIFSCRILDGNYPKVPELYPKEENYVGHFEVSRKALIDSFSRITLLTDEKNKLAILEIKNSILSISSGSERGKALESMSLVNSDNEIKIAFNIFYVVDALKIFESDSLIFSYSKPNQPVVIVGNNSEKDTLKYLVMPVQIKD